jgi:CRISPR-associated protein Cas5d
MTPETHVLEVWGEFACFTRPELKVERFSYPVITPSAARGLFDAIYCKVSVRPTHLFLR